MTSTDTFINCPGTCFHDYIVPTAGVSLHATPSASSTFTGWTNCTTPSGNNCTMNVNGVKSVTATFQSSDSTPPTAAMAEPHLAFNIGKRIALVWSGNDDKGSGVATFDVRMRKAKFNTHTFGSFTNVAGLQGTASTSAIFTAAPGFTYCFSVRATDNAANRGSYSGQKCTMVPVDDKAMTHSSGWTQQSNVSGDYPGTISRPSTQGKTMTLAGVHAKQLALLVTVCSGCGKVKLTFAGNPTQFHWRMPPRRTASSTRHLRTPPSRPGP